MEDGIDVLLEDVVDIHAELKALLLESMIQIGHLNTPVG